MVNYQASVQDMMCKRRDPGFSSRISSSQMLQSGRCGGKKKCNVRLCGCDACTTSGAKQLLRHGTGRLAQPIRVSIQGSQRVTWGGCSCQRGMYAWMQMGGRRATWVGRRHGRGSLPRPTSAAGPGSGRYEGRSPDRLV